ncbi:MAG: isoprenylcysteine carboxylmethyltransferase family protein [Anaerolineae bacterium]|nr:isoprenylcysteine carboxylmethyltransferase family protein [Anaerolineae bacterium]
MSHWRQWRAVLALPGLVLVGVPSLILWQTRSLRLGWDWPSPWLLVPILAGLSLIGWGLRLMAQTIRLFMTVGQGTLAPWDAPRRLVVLGPYRHVRNPMISGVLAVLLGEALLLGSRPLLAWFLIVLVVNLVYIPLLEEPGLEARFGDDYRLYRHHVPRWLPRRTPWEPPQDNATP